VAGVAHFRTFVERAADLVASYGGSLSGEHGDGQARGELLTTMFGPEVVDAFRACKRLFDPEGTMNPGKVVDPFPLDGDLRLGADHEHRSGPTWFRYPDDDGSFSRAALRCVGVGNCRSDHGGVMCPSYRATRREEDSTRGRARLLFEMLDGGRRGGAIRDGWRSKAVLGALDLCLACKGCRSECPVEVDMATYKAEFLAHHFHHRLRPRSHYSMGWLPLVSAGASRAPGLVNALTHAPGLGRLAKVVAGIDRQRSVPSFATETFTTWMAGHRPTGDGRRGRVILWPDTFTNRFHPEVGRAAVQVLEDAGWEPFVPRQALCCGLTWISTGQLATARRVLGRTLAVLAPHLRDGTLVVGLEPSCTAVFRSDAFELLERSEDVERLRHQTVTLAELLTGHSPGWEPPRRKGQAVVQPHCHHQAIMHFGPDHQLLADVFADGVDVVEGCCGLAGNFGFEAGHHDVSVACANHALLPAISDADPSVTVVADGFSCRTQVEQLAGRRARHLAEVLAG
jgi:Fe-S oxidoreductase